jgi:hypothetical protein
VSTAVAPPGATWAGFEAAAPDIAAEARRLIAARGGEALLATVRDGELPRIHPVNVAVVDGRLYAFVIGRSAKRLDLETDGRFAMHTHVDPAVPAEVSLRGRARLVDDDDERSRVAARWAFEADETYTLFEFSIETALRGARATADDWPPRYTSWSSRSRAGRPAPGRQG